MRDPNQYPHAIYFKPPHEAEWLLECAYKDKHRADQHIKRQKQLYSHFEWEYRFEGKR